jgi:hypothetical protein
MMLTAARVRTALFGLGLILSCLTSSAAHADSDETDLLVQMSLIEGHMIVGLELYKRGDLKAAETHLQHPSDEIYVTLKPMLKVREQSGFARELDAMSKAITYEKPPQVVNAVSKKLFIRMNRNRPKKLSASLAARTISKLMYVAAEEYSVGVKGGKIVNTHEYQDAWGFTIASARLLTSIDAAEREKHHKNLMQIEKELAGLATLWPDISGRKPIKRKPRELAAAAARIEKIATSIR